jgi:hypothetical protein
MTAVLIFRAVAHQSDVTGTGKALNESQRKFLPVILDAAATRIDRPVHEDFGSIPAGELRP